MGETWVNCKNCGYRYGSWISKCPQCGTENKVARKAGMGKGKKIGIVIGGIIGAFLIFGIVAAGAGQMGQISKYEGLTDKQVSAIRILEDSCDNQASLASMQSEVGNIVRQKCDETIAKKIEDYRAQNQGTSIQQVNETEVLNADTHDVVTLDNISYEVVEVAKASSADGYRANGIFVVVTLSMENKGNQPGEVIENNFRLIDSQDRQFSTDRCLCGGDRLYNYESINPGLEMTKRIVFDVPLSENEHYLLEIGNKGFSNSDPTQVVHIDLGSI